MKEEGNWKIVKDLDEAKRELYLDERGKFAKGNPGGGRPPDPKPEEHEDEVKKIYEGWVEEFCNLAEVETFEDLSPMVRTLLQNARKLQLDVETIGAKKKRSSNDQKLLSSLVARVNNALIEAHNMIRKQLAIRKEKRSGTKKPTGMY